MISEKAREWLNNEYSYTNPYFMNSQTVWEILKKAKAGNTYAVEIWKEYSDKVRLPENAKDVKINSFKELVQTIYKV